MLNLKKMLEISEGKYEDMFKQINIVDFTKTIAIWSNLKLEHLKDDVVAAYLLKWAENKHHIFKLLGNKVRIDDAIEYHKSGSIRESQYEALIKDYVIYRPWLKALSKIQEPEIPGYRWDVREIYDLAADIKIAGMKVTHFCTKVLQMPENLIAKVASIYEDNVVNSKYTLSIDPVDMMFASENPYNWSSCYKLTNYDSDSHADGCIAAVLDQTTIIAYAWDTEGEFSLCDNDDTNHTFKKVRYKKLRQWVGINNANTHISYCKVYPSTNQELETDLFNKFKQIVATQLGKKNEWYKTGNTWGRDYYYGYGEFFNNTHTLPDNLGEDIKMRAYTEQVLCPCGCGEYLCGSDGGGDQYQGYGFTHNNFYEDEPEEEYCSLSDSYCDHASCQCEDCCRGCGSWDDAHPTCQYSDVEDCEVYRQGDYNEEEDEVCDGVAHMSICTCSEKCSYYKERLKAYNIEQKEALARVARVAEAASAASRWSTTSQTALQNCISSINEAASLLSNIQRDSELVPEDLNAIG